MGLGSVIGSLFSGGATKIIDSVGGVLDNLTTSKEEKEAAKLALAQEINRHMEAVEAAANEQFELEIQDLNSARVREVELAKTEVSWFSKNIVALLAAYLVVCTTIIDFAVIFKETKLTDSGVISMILGALNVSSLASVLSYYFGSSHKRDQFLGKP